MTIDTMCLREKISDSSTSYYLHQPELDFFQQPTEEFLVSGQINILPPEYYNDEPTEHDEDMDDRTVFASEASEDHSPHGLFEIDLDYQDVFGPSSQPSSVSSPNQTTSRYAETNVAPYRRMDTACMEGVFSGGNSGNGGGGGGAGVAGPGVVEAGDSMYIVASSSDCLTQHPIISWAYGDSQDWNPETEVWSPPPPPPPPPPPDPETVGLWTVFAVGAPILDLSGSTSFMELLPDQEQGHEGFGFQVE